MARRWRCSDAGYVYHVLNRAVGRARIFDKSADYAAFEKVLRQGWERTGMRLLAYVIMPNHWHLVLWPQRDGAMSTYAQMAYGHARAPLARPPSYGGHGTGLSGALQVIPRPSGRPLLHAVPLCGAQCATGKTCQTSRKLAVVKFVVPGSGRCQADGVAQ